MESMMVRDYSFVNAISSIRDEYNVVTRKTLKIRYEPKRRRTTSAHERI